MTDVAEYKLFVRGLGKNKLVYKCTVCNAIRKGRYCSRKKMEAESYPVKLFAMMKKIKDKYTFTRGDMNIVLKMFNDGLSNVNCTCDNICTKEFYNEYFKDMCEHIISTNIPTDKQIENILLPKYLMIPELYYLFIDMLVKYKDNFIKDWGIRLAKRGYNLKEYDTDVIYTIINMVNPIRNYHHQTNYCCTDEYSIDTINDTICRIMDNKDYINGCMTSFIHYLVNSRDYVPPVNVIVELHKKSTGTCIGEIEEKLIPNSKELRDAIANVADDGFMTEAVCDILLLDNIPNRSAVVRQKIKHLSHDHYAIPDYTNTARVIEYYDELKGSYYDNKQVNKTAFILSEIDKEISNGLPIDDKMIDTIVDNIEPYAAMRYLIDNDVVLKEDIIDKVFMRMCDENVNTTTNLPYFISAFMMFKLDVTDAMIMMAIKYPSDGVIDIINNGNRKITYDDVYKYIDSDISFGDYKINMELIGLKYTNEFLAFIISRRMNFACYETDYKSNPMMTAYKYIKSNKMSELISYMEENKLQYDLPCLHIALGGNNDNTDIVMHLLKYVQPDANALLLSCSFCKKVNNELRKRFIHKC